MEHLLSTSFDLLSSYDPVHIRKGLRCLEGFLAKMCLQAPGIPRRGTSNPPVEQRASLATPVTTRPKDAAFKEFLRLQNGFEWNVTIRLISCLERLLGRTNSGQNNLLILSTLDLIQGMLLLHPSSRKLFAREIHMNVLLDLLDAGNSGPVQCATLLTLTFEVLDGLATVTSLFKRRDTPREVKLKILEFLYFYLMPETVSAPAATALKVPGERAPGERLPSKSPRKIKDEARIERTTEEKQKMLGEFMSNIEGLVADLRESQPFGM